jgi:nitrogen regulatory protein P-II 1
MYQLTAVFNKTCLNDVLQELFEKKIEGVTVTDVIGKGGIGFIEENGTPDLDSKVMMLIVLSNDVTKEIAMEAIRSNTQDLGHGAGKLWVTPVLEVERVRTGERNEQALSQSAHRLEGHVSKHYYNEVDTPAS